ncbi:hypothetical protein R3I93_010675 [Phoxinus phoxinus]|uniref:Uncharacterized protein n=1 Tax=Phoxinus phoxinus TaxID=58324 RepID=A0AAN9CWB9_9TELE
MIYSRLKKFRRFTRSVSGNNILAVLGGRLELET